MTTSRPWLGITTPPWLKESDTPQCHGTIASVGATMWNAAPVVADRPVAGGGLGERVTVGPAGAVVAGQPGQVLANPG